MKINSLIKNIYLRYPLSVWIGLVVVFVILAGVLTFFSQVEILLTQSEIFKYREGDIVLEDYYIQKDLVFLDEHATEKRKNMKASLTHPVYVKQPQISKNVLDSYSLFSGLLLSLVSEDIEKNIIQEELAVQFPGILSEELVDSLLGMKDLPQFLSVTNDALAYVMGEGIISESSYNGTVRDSQIIDILENNADFDTRSSYLWSSVITENNIRQELQIFLEESKLSSIHWDLVYILVSFFSRENCFYSERLTEYGLEQALQQVEPVIIKYNRGDLFLRKGTLITEDYMMKIEAIKGQNRSVSLISVLEVLVFLFITFSVVGIVFHKFSISLSVKNFWLFMFLSVFFVISSAFILAFVHLGKDVFSFFLLPISLFGILFTQLTGNSKSGMIVVSAYSFIIFYLTGMDYGPFFYLLLVGNAGSLIVGNARRRIDMIFSGVYMALIQGGAAFIIYLFYLFPMPGMLKGISIAMSVGFMSGIFSLALIPLFELFFNYCTTFRLVELADQTAPVLKRMLIQAPGTYVHSLNVANMAESACQEIKANSLLARVGAYYHDIGKIDQAEYFIENQNKVNGNKHDDIKANLSAAVIKSHVKVGAEKGSELRLPTQIVDIIQQHHGTSTIHYFYDRALKENGNTKINLDDFRHSGPKPQSKEAAVVMLADITEAATRTLKKPTVSKLEKMIWDLIKERFQLGELNECDLTLKDLESIKNSFVKVLAGHFHTRIEYPGQKEEENEE